MTTLDSIAEAERRARRRLPRSVFLAVQGGCERGLTATTNVSAFDELHLLPRLMAAQPVNLATTVMGQDLAFPVMIAPTGAKAVHPAGETAVAAAAREAGTAVAVSIFASQPIVDIAAVNSKTMLQVYWLSGREVMAEILARARAAGVSGLIVTVDWFGGTPGRDWGRVYVPSHLGVGELLRFAPETLKRPQWLMRTARSGRLPVLTVPNVAGPGKPVLSLAEAFGLLAQPTWDDLAWLRQQWTGPFMIKGITRVADARHAAQIGATAVSVSNHGGNLLDDVPAAIRLLPAVADAIGDDIEVVFDGGIRRGSDVVKALALGARAVMVGRPYLWGLAVGGQRGVQQVLGVLRDGMVVTMNALGRSDVKELSPADLIVPSGFAVLE